MAIKRKTHLNLSGSHHTLDSDNAFVGGTLYITGTLSASAGITGSIHYVDAVGSVPFLVNGTNITTNYNSLGQWEITGSGGGGSVTGSNTQVQFNDDGAFGASSLLTFNTASVGNVGVGTLTYLTGAVGYLSGSNIDNQAYTLVMSGVADVELATPGFFDPALVVKTPVLMTQSLMLFDGIHDPFNLGVDTSLPGGGIALANGSRFTLHSGSWTPLPSDSGGKDPVVTVEVDTNGSGSVQVVGSLLVQSASLDQYNVFSVLPSTTANQLRMTHVGEANFFSGAVNLSHNASILFISGSSNDHGFEVSPSNASGGARLRVNSGSIEFNSSSQDAQVGNTSFLIQASTDAHKADVIFDQGLDNVNFVGINVRPLYVTMSTTTATGTELSGSLLASLLKEGSVGKLDFNVVAAASATDDYASWTFSTTVRRNQAGTTLVLAATELDSITEGTNASAWDVNVNSDGTIQCTGSAGTVNWYAQVTKKMILSGSGMIVY